MALENKFDNKPNKIDLIDERLIFLHERIGYFWQDKTGKPADNLKSGFYSTSWFGLTVSGLIYQSPILLTSSVISLAYVAFGQSFLPKDPSETETLTSQMGLPAKSFKYFGAINYFCGGALTLCGLAQTAVVILSGDRDLTNEGFAIASFGASGFAFSSANYLYHTDFRPPKK